MIFFNQGKRNEDGTFLITMLNQSKFSFLDFKHFLPPKAFEIKAY